MRCGVTAVCVGYKYHQRTLGRLSLPHMGESSSWCCSVSPGRQPAAQALIICWNLWPQSSDPWMRRTISRYMCNCQLYYIFPNFLLGSHVMFHPLKVGNVCWCDIDNFKILTKVVQLSAMCITSSDFISVGFYWIRMCECVHCTGRCAACSACADRNLLTITFRYLHTKE